MSIVNCPSCENSVNTCFSDCFKCGADNIMPSSVLTREVSDPKKLKIIIGLFFMAILLGGYYLLFEQSINLISYKVLNRSEKSTLKVSYDIEVPLVNNKLPTKEQLGAISNHLISKDTSHKKSFVSFYLPRMKVGHGSYATAHHMPTMQVKVMYFMLIDYSEYHHFIPEITNALSNRWSLLYPFI